MSAARTTPVTVADGRTRCPWVELDKPDYVAYHDQQWGVPVHDDRLLFEYLTLEGAQAGLSWYTVLRKREAYREAFANFDIASVAALPITRIEILMGNAGLVRNRQKLESTLGNARACLKLQEEFGAVSDYLWSFVDHTVQVNAPRTRADYRATSAESDAMSRELKRRGFKFVGSTIMYAFMQAVGMVNDHADDCFRQSQVVEALGHQRR